MSEVETGNEALSYEVPRVVKNLGAILRLPRSYYSTNFTEAFSPDEDVQYEYVNGLLAVMVSILVIFVFWAFCLCVLKFKGEEVGCASGSPFLTQRAEDVDGIPSTDESESSSSMAPSSSFSDGDGSVQQLVERHRAKNGESSDLPTGKAKVNEGEDHSFHDSPDEILCAEAQAQMLVNRREYRTRACFLFFAVVALVCVPLTLIYSFGPMREVAQSSDKVIADSREVIDEVDVSLEFVESALQTATNIVEGTELNVFVICPNIDREVDPTIGKDLRDLVNAVTKEYDQIVTASVEEIDFVYRLMKGFGDGISKFETSVEEAEEYLWIVPGVLFSVILLSVMSMIGVVLAWKGTSGRSVQSFMSYGVLPFFMVAIALCWLVLIFAALGTMIGSDMCTGGTASGTPDDTVHQILDIQKVDLNSTTFHLVYSSTNQCDGPSPTERLESLQRSMQGTIDKIWRQISKIDSIGRSNVIEQCGSDELTNLLASARNLAKLLTSVRRSVDSTSASLDCGRINAIYAEGAYDTICTDAASASAYGFIFFLLLALSLMTMVSLRASWLQNIEEDKVYHDENEMAENMIVDEHEEYLAYISRYKHEWQEYGGFEESHIVSRPYSEEESYFSDGGSDELDDGYGGADEDSYDGSLERERDNLNVAVFDTSNPITPRTDMDQISLPQLDNDLAFKSPAAHSMCEEDFFKVPSPARNPLASKRERSGSRSKLSTSQHSQAEAVDSTEKSVSTNREAAATSVTVNVDLPIQTASEGQQPPENRTIGFFERYGILPGVSARRRTTPTRPMPASPTGMDPPGTVSRPTARGTAYDPDEAHPCHHHQRTHGTQTTTTNNNYHHQEFPRSSSLPRGRSFFKASEFEVEVQIGQPSSSLSGSEA